MLSGNYHKDKDVLHAMIENGHGHKQVSDLRFYDGVWAGIEIELYTSLNNEKKEQDK